MRFFNSPLAFSPSPFSRPLTSFFSSSERKAREEGKSKKISSKVKKEEASPEEGKGERERERIV